MNDLAVAITGSDLPAYLNLDSSRGNESVGSQLTILVLADPENVQ